MCEIKLGLSKRSNLVDLPRIFLYDQGDFEFRQGEEEDQFHYPYPKE